MKEDVSVPGTTGWWYFTLGYQDQGSETFLIVCFLKGRSPVPSEWWGSRTSYEHVNTSAYYPDSISYGLYLCLCKQIQHISDMSTDVPKLVLVTIATELFQIYTDTSAALPGKKKKRYMQIIFSDLDLRTDF